MKGAKFLKVTGILMIIFSAIALVLEIILAAGIAALGVAAVESNVSLGTVTSAISPTVWIAVVLGFVGVVAEFVAGIIGVANAKKPEKANTCFIWGVIVIAVNVISNIVMAITYPAGFSVWSALSGLVLPVLYLIGAVLNKKSAE